VRTVFITGGAGYLGSELATQARAAGWNVAAPSHASLDVRDARAVAEAAEGASAIVHTAYRNAGDDMRATNVDGSAVVARLAAEKRVRLIHLSSDLVFDGTTTRPYREDDEPRAVIPYGESKLAGERAVLEAMPDALVVRTSLLYGKKAPGLHERAVLDALDGRVDMKFFDDEMRCPTRVDDLAAALLELVDLSVNGVLHVAGPDVLSRYDFARAIAVAAGRDPSSLRRGSCAGTGRPRDCSLDTTRARALLKTTMRGVAL